MNARRLFPVLTVVLTAVMLLTSCGDDSPPPSSSPTTTLPDDPAQGQGTPKHTFATVPVDAAEQLAVKFIGLYGTFTPAAPDPGRTWLSSWRSLALPEVSTRAEREFDQLWGWTWDQQVQTQDVLPTGPAQIDSSFGTITVRIPARRYVIGLLAHHPEDGQWQPTHFEVVVGPRTAGDPTSQLAVYRIEMRGA